VLACCLTEIRNGRRTLGDCLEAFPEFRDELQPLLELALRIGPVSGLTPEPARKLQARHRFVEALATERQLTWWKLALAPRQLSTVAASGGRALSAAVVAATLLTVGIGGGAVLAAQESRPGDVLYGVKTIAEQVQVAAALTESDRAETQLWVSD
jgi:hypothetical protein